MALDKRDRAILNSFLMEVDKHIAKLEAQAEATTRKEDAARWGQWAGDLAYVTNDMYDTVSRL